MPRWTKSELEEYQQREKQGGKRIPSSKQKLPTPSEHAIQSAFIRWATLAQREHPELMNLFAVPNGGLRPFDIDSKGRRYSTVARKMKAEGVKEGVPDILLLVPRLGYHGLAIETKRPGGRVSPVQAEWHKRLQDQGYFVKVCFSVEEMIAITKWYLQENSSSR